MNSFKKFSDGIAQGGKDVYRGIEEIAISTISGIEHNVEGMFDVLNGLLHGDFRRAFADLGATVQNGVRNAERAAGAVVRTASALVTAVPNAVLDAVSPEAARLVKKCQRGIESGIEKTVSDIYEAGGGVARGMFRSVTDMARGRTADWLENGITVLGNAAMLVSFASPVRLAGAFVANVTEQTLASIGRRGGAG
ncbi:MULTISPECIES: hypothetical protein [Burkholderia]|uniref:hypothetical protein n=1 Tax=Burkholderia TaxID=32008 RepID=UPI000841DD64|nr:MULTISPECIES: hypothetical protein [unclassified Burkholderia]AOK29070.1 hypothetical protein AQ611_06155 [Burkholderia sp. Bp7605]